MPITISTRNARPESIVCPPRLYLSSPFVICSVWTPGKIVLEPVQAVLPTSVPMARVFPIDGTVHVLPSYPFAVFFLSFLLLGLDIWGLNKTMYQETFCFATQEDCGHIMHCPAHAPYQCADLTCQTSLSLCSSVVQCPPSEDCDRLSI